MSDRQFRPKICEGCQTTFTPRGGRQKKCDECRPIVIRNLPPVKKDKVPTEKECQSCGKTFVLSGPGRPPRFCDECRSIDPIKKEYTCLWCQNTFSIEGPGRPPKFCDNCKDDNSFNRCSCGSPISGRAKWGNQWGGGCDRVEARIDDLMRRLSGHLR